MSERVIEERHGFPAALRALGGVGQIGAAGPRARPSSVTAPPGRCEHLGGGGGHVEAPHVDR